MGSEACCAHSCVVYNPILHRDESYSSRWSCVTCDADFVPAVVYLDADLKRIAAEAELARLREQTRWRDVVTEPPTDTTRCYVFRQRDGNCEFTSLDCVLSDNATWVTQKHLEWQFTHWCPLNAPPEGK